MAGCGACGFGQTRTKSRDSLWTHDLAYVCMLVCLMRSSFVLFFSRIASVHSYSLGIASTYSVAYSRLYGVALQRSAVHSAVRYRFAAYGTASA